MFFDIVRQLHYKKWWGTLIDLSDSREAERYPAHYSVRNLKYMAKFTKIYPDREFVQTMSAQIPWTHNIIQLHGAGRGAFYKKLFFSEYTLTFFPLSPLDTSAYFV